MGGGLSDGLLGVEIRGGGEGGGERGGYALAFLHALAIRLLAARP